VVGRGPDKPLEHDDGVVEGYLARVEMIEDAGEKTVEVFRLGEPKQHAAGAGEFCR
jgi:hypothetical protein